MVMSAAADDLTPLKYNNPGLVVDLHVGLWSYPVPCDFDGDGDNDLLVACPDKPTKAVMYFENTEGDVLKPVFKAPVKVGPSMADITPSYTPDGLRLLSRNKEILDLKQGGFEQTKTIYPTAEIHIPREKYTVRENQWSYVDYDGDGDLDLIAGVADWEDYGMQWSGAGWARAYGDNGVWTLGPLHGYVYLIRNTGTKDEPTFDDPVKVEAGDGVVDVYGRPSPNFVDFDGDGDLDLLCGEFLDGFTYFKNVGTRTEPKYEAGRRLMHEGEQLALDLEMIVPVAYDWDKDGDYDLIVGDEDGRVALVENTGKFDENGTPVFNLPYYFQQEADDVYFGALTTPVCVDWDGDGDQDIIAGNSAGYIAFIENLDGGNLPKWARPVRLKADLLPIRIMAGYNGDCQGPSEVKWGYTTLSVADWDNDQLPDLVVNSVWGKVVWYENVGQRTWPLLTATRPIDVEWPGVPPKEPTYWWTPQGRELATQWRTTPVVIDWDGDGLQDLVMLDPEGYLAYYHRTMENGVLRLQPPQRIFKADGPSVFDTKHAAQSDEPGLLQLNNGVSGRAGRRKLHLADWDGDGHLDLLVNSISVNWMKGRPGENGEYIFKEMGPLSDMVLAGHTTSPTTVDWDNNGIPDLLLGAEDGRFYYLKNPRASQ
ncbi:MAG: VCBS repeat-containing protein [Phycisphaeraceae bacterium]|nr:VCBS repeat-containing protein [Phycisphaeraceae bacterium]